MNNLVIFILSLVLFFFSVPSAEALKLPASLKSSVLKILPISRIRLDGAIETYKGHLYLPLIPAQPNQDKKEVSIKAIYPTKGSPDFLLFDNGWCFLKVLNSGGERSVISLNDLPPELRKYILATKFASDIIVPDKFNLPISLKPVASNISVNFKESDKNKNLAGNQENNKKNTPNVIKADAAILITSPATGKVSLLSYPELVKMIEFPMEGTPSGVTYSDGKVYIADQTKSRILKLDPYRKVFLGQIDLPKQSAPKDVVALPGGKLICVSESKLNDIAIIETDTDKVLLRTKVHSYPGRMALTPSGNLLLVLSVPDGRVSLISPQNQRFLGTLAVGSLPSGIATSANDKIAYISNRLSNTVSVLDLTKHAVTLTIKTGVGPTGVAIDNDHNRLYVVNAKDNSISVYDAVNNKKEVDIKLPMELDFPGSITLLPDKKHLLVTSESTDSVGLLDITTNSFEKVASIGHNSEQCLWIPGHD